MNAEQMTKKGTQALVMIWMVCTPLMSAYAQQSETVKERVAQINQQLFDALIKGDADTIVSLYTTDATLFPPDGQTVKGEKAIRNYWAGSIKSSKTLTVSTENIAFERYNENTAYESGRYTLKYKTPDSGKAQSAEGIYLIIWKKVGRSWKLHVDMWN